MGREFKDIQGHFSENVQFSRTFQDIQGHLKNSRIFKDFQGAWPPCYWFQQLGRSRADYPK